MDGSVLEVQIGSSAFDLGDEDTGADGIVDTKGLTGGLLQLKNVLKAIMSHHTARPYDGKAKNLTCEQ